MKEEGASSTCEDETKRASLLSSFSFNLFSNINDFVCAAFNPSISLDLVCSVLRYCHDFVCSLNVYSCLLFLIWFNLNYPSFPVLLFSGLITFLEYIPPSPLKHRYLISLCLRQRVSRASSGLFCLCRVPSFNSLVLFYLLHRSTGSVCTSRGRSTLCLTHLSNIEFNVNYCVSLSPAKYQPSIQFCPKFVIISQIQCIFEYRPQNSEQIIHVV